MCSLNRNRFRDDDFDDVRGIDDRSFCHLHDEVSGTSERDRHHHHDDVEGISDRRCCLRDINYHCICSRQR